MCILELYYSMMHVRGRAVALIGFEAVEGRDKFHNFSGFCCDDFRNSFKSIFRKPHRAFEFSVHSETNLNYNLSTKLLLKFSNLLEF